MIFGIALPYIVALLIAEIGKDYFKDLPSDTLPLALFGGMRYKFFNFLDKRQVIGEPHKNAQHPSFVERPVVEAQAL
jgi:hypothetical protein